jgi:hypothetical protein
VGSFEQSFADLDTALIDAVGDDATLDVDGDGVTVLPVRGAFKDPQIRPTLGRTRTEIIEPHFKGKSVDLSAAKEGTSVLTVNGLAYEVVHKDPDGTGITTLVLRPNS